MNAIKKVDISTINIQKYKQQTNIRRQQQDKKISFDWVVLATDQDLDGIHIRGILISFFMKSSPNIIKEGRLKQLRTPLIILKKNNKIQYFFFTFDEFNEWCKLNDVSKYQLKYMKGLGSWKQDELIELFTLKSVDYFIDTLEWTTDSMKHVHQWLSSSEIPQRKEYLMNNTFDMVKV